MPEISQSVSEHDYIFRSIYVLTSTKHNFLRRIDHIRLTPKRKLNAGCHNAFRSATERYVMRMGTNKDCDSWWCECLQVCGDRVLARRYLWVNAARRIDYPSSIPAIWVAVDCVRCRLQRLDKWVSERRVPPIV